MAELEGLGFSKVALVGVAAVAREPPGPMSQEAEVVTVGVGVPPPRTNTSAIIAPSYWKYGRLVYSSPVPGSMADWYMPAADLHAVEPHQDGHGFGGVLGRHDREAAVLAGPVFDVVDAAARGVAGAAQRARGGRGAEDRPQRGGREIVLRRYRHRDRRVQDGYRTGIIVMRVLPGVLPQEDREEDEEDPPEKPNHASVEANGKMKRRNPSLTKRRRRSPILWASCTNPK